MDDESQSLAMTDPAYLAAKVDVLHGLFFHLGTRLMPNQELFDLVQHVVALQRNLGEPRPVPERYLQSLDQFERQARSTLLD
jgi:hypothetical protein